MQQFPGMYAQGSGSQGQGQPSAGGSGGSNPGNLFQALLTNPTLLTQMLQAMKEGKLSPEHQDVIRRVLQAQQQAQQAQHQQSGQQQMSLQQAQQLQQAAPISQEALAAEVNRLMTAKNQLQVFLASPDHPDEVKHQAKNRFSGMINSAHPTARNTALALFRRSQQQGGGGPQTRQSQEAALAAAQQMALQQQHAQAAAGGGSSQAATPQPSGAEPPRKRQRSTSVQAQSPAAAASPAQTRFRSGAGPGHLGALPSPATATPTGMVYPKPEPEAGPPARPTLNQGLATSSSLSTPAIQKPPSAIASQKDDKGVVGKKRLQEMLETIDPEASLDGDVEDLLLDITDEFIESVTRFACRLAQHRHSERLEAQDVALHLDRNWSMSLPGWYYSHEGTEAARLQLNRKANLPQGYLQRVAAVKEAQQRRR